jgi:PAS domain S-box-containing protein
MRNTWSDMAEAAAPIWDRALAGEPVALEDQLWTYSRHGEAPEDCWFTNSFVPLRDEAGRVGGLLVTAFETTATVREKAERDRAEAAYRQSQARLQVAMELVGMYTYGWRPGADTFEWDPLLKAVWGLPPDADIDAATFLAGVHPDDRDRVAAVAEDLARPDGLTEYAIEYRVVGLGGGRERWISTHGRRHVEEGGECAIIGALVDITERKQVELELRGSRARLAGILEQLPVGVGMVDGQGRLVTSNEVFREFVGRSRPWNHADSRWRSADDRGRPAARGRWPVEGVLRGESPSAVDFLRTTREGAERWARVTAAPFNDADGRLAGAVCVIQDIHEEKRAQQAREVLISELQHRTRNLLAVVRAVASQTLGHAPEMEAFDSRLRALGRLQGLVSRSEGERMELGALVRSEIGALGGSRAARARIDGPSVLLTQEQAQTLALALHELATNAVKYGALGDPRGALSVSWNVGAPDRLALVWRESGVVMPVGQTPRVGYGREMIEEALPFVLGATTRMDFAPGGICCEIELPLGVGP